MNSKLDAVRNWPELAKQAAFRIQRMARECDVTVRQLERYFRCRFRMTARDWITRQRLKVAVKLLLAGSSVKEAAAQLSYAEPSHFSRAFKRIYGKSPKAFRSSVRTSAKLSSSGMKGRVGA